MTTHEYYRTVIQRKGRTKNMPREKIEFPKNVPQELALAFPTGKEGTSPRDNEPYFLYSTVDDRVFFASATLNQKIQSLRPRAHERLEICLRNDRSTEGKNQWDVRLIDGERGVSAPPAPRITARPSGNGQVTNGHANGSSNGNGHASGNGNGQAVTPFVMTGQGQGMLEQFIATYEVLCAVENYSRLKGREVQFTSEDFRAVAISCFIQQSRGGR